MLLRPVPDKEDGAERSLFTFRLPQVRHSGSSEGLATRTSLTLPHSKQRKSKRGIFSSFTPSCPPPSRGRKPYYYHSKFPSLGGRGNGISIGITPRGTALCCLVGVCFLVLFDRLFQGFDGKADAVLLLIWNLNQPPEDIAVLDFQGLGKRLAPDEISQGHGG